MDVLIYIPYILGDDDDEDEGTDEDVEDDGDLSNGEAARLMNALRQKEEEDDEFEMAFKSLMLESVSKAPKASISSGGSSVSTGSSKVAASAAFTGDRMGESLFVIADLVLDYFFYDTVLFVSSNSCLSPEAEKCNRRFPTTH